MSWFGPVSGANSTRVGQWNCICSRPNLPNLDAHLHRVLVPREPGTGIQFSVFGQVNQTVRKAGQQPDQPIMRFEPGHQFAIGRIADSDFGPDVFLSAADNVNVAILGITLDQPFDIRSGVSSDNEFKAQMSVRLVREEQVRPIGNRTGFSFAFRDHEAARFVRERGQKRIDRQSFWFSWVNVGENAHVITSALESSAQQVFDRKNPVQYRVIFAVDWGVVKPLQIASSATRKDCFRHSDATLFEKVAGVGFEPTTSRL